MARKVKPYVTPMRKKWWAFKKKLPNWVRWYILKDYHCDKCPMCWSDYSEYTGDGDCGCHIFGDIREDGCRLIPPIRTLIGWPKKKRAEYAYSHQYDDMADWYETYYQREEAFRSCIKQLLDGFLVIQRDFEGKARIVDEEHFDSGYGFGSHINDAFRAYEDECYPTHYISLKHEWKNVITRTKQEMFHVTAPDNPAATRQLWDARRKNFSECVLKMLEWYELDKKMPNGMIVPVCKVSLLDELSFAVMETIRKYDAEAHPVVPTSLKEDWSHVLKRTWKMKVHDKILPYFEK